MKIVFWSPSGEGRTARNMDILANTFQIYHGFHVRTVHDYTKACRYAQGREDMVFVNCENDKNVRVRNLLRTADTVVVNFPEKKMVLNSYFMEHHEILGNIFYLISSSPANIFHNNFFIRRFLRLGEEETGEIPFNARFEERYAQKRGFSYQQSLSERALLGVEEEFVLKSREIAVKILKMNCLLQ